MRNYTCLVVFIVTNLIAPFSAQAQKQSAKSPKILSAKTVYFDNQTGVDAVGIAALAQLRKWGRFQVVQDKKAADLIFLLSADPYQGATSFSRAAKPERWMQTDISNKTAFPLTTGRLRFAMPI